MGTGNPDDTLARKLEKNTCFTCSIDMIMSSDASNKETYNREELCSGTWLSTRGFEVFEKLEEYQIILIKRLKRASSALETAGIPYGVVGGNAVAAWVASVDESAVRSTQDVNTLLRRSDLDAAKIALEKVDLL